MELEDVFQIPIRPHRLLPSDQLHVNKYNTTVLVLPLWAAGLRPEDPILSPVTNLCGVDQQHVRNGCRVVVCASL